MKKKTIVSLALLSLFLVGLVALAPYILKKPQPAKTNKTVASYAASRGNPVQEITPTNDVNPSGTGMTNPNPNPDPAPNSKVVSSRKDLRPIKPKPPEIMLESKLPIVEVPKAPQAVNLPAREENEAPIKAPIEAPIVEVIKSEEAPPSSDDTSNPTPESSRWGVTALVTTESGVDVGVCYRVAEFPILGEIALDLVVATKQAGIGLSKDVYHNLGIGVIGTVGYLTGEAEVGIYLKYSF